MACQFDDAAKLLDTLSHSVANALSADELREVEASARSSDMSLLLDLMSRGWRGLRER